MTEVYLLFFSHVLSLFVRYNSFLQHEEPIIGAIYEQVVHSNVLVYPNYHVLHVCIVDTQVFAFLVKVHGGKSSYRIQGLLRSTTERKKTSMKVRILHLLINSYLICTYMQMGNFK